MAEYCEYIFILISCDHHTSFSIIRFVRVNIIKNIVMGVSVGSVFFQTKAVDGIFGVLFQGMLFIMLGMFLPSLHGSLTMKPFVVSHANLSCFWMQLRLNDCSSRAVGR